MRGRKSRQGLWGMVPEATIPGGKVNMTTEEILRDVRARLVEAFGPRLRGIILYGSTARGDARPDSDIDLLVLLEGPVDVGEDIHTTTLAIYPVMLQTGRIIDANPVDVKNYDKEVAPVYCNAKREGIAV
jgi:uncharacterized protein